LRTSATERIDTARNRCALDRSLLIVTKRGFARLIASRVKVSTLEL
jgi:hypothetical protein